MGGQGKGDRPGRGEIMEQLELTGMWSVELHRGGWGRITLKTILSITWKATDVEVSENTYIQRYKR